MKKVIEIKEFRGDKSLFSKKIDFENVSRVYLTRSIVGSKMDNAIVEDHIDNA